MSFAIVRVNMRLFFIFTMCFALASPALTNAHELSKKKQLEEQQVAEKSKKEADEAQSKSDRDGFMASTESSLSICGFKGKLMAMQMSSWDIERAKAGMEEISDCSSKEKAHIAESYPAISKGLADKPEALKALKRYYAFWMTSMDAFLQNVTEGSRVYEMITNSNKQKLDDLYNQYRLEVE